MCSIVTPSGASFLCQQPFGMITRSPARNVRTSSSLANCQLGAARKHMQELIVARVKLPRRPPGEARDATDAAVEIKRLDLAWRLLGRSGEITSDHLADGVSAEVMNNHRTFLVLGPKGHASAR